METLIKIWKNKWLIAQGLWNKIFKTDTVERVSKSRMKICKKCDAFDEFGSKCIVPKTQPCCGLCGCSLSIKTRSMDSECPHLHKKWGPVYYPQSVTFSNQPPTFSNQPSNQDGSNIQSGES